MTKKEILESVHLRAFLKIAPSQGGTAPKYGDRPERAQIRGKREPAAR